MAKCLALRPETSVECDFVLQAIAMGVHRTTRDLAQSAQDIARRAEGLAASVLASATEPQCRRMAAALETLRWVYHRPGSGKPPADLTGQRKRWLAVRRGVREVVMASPDVDFHEVVFFTVPARAAGNHPDGLVQNHDRPKERRPGGDIMVQAGLNPQDAARPLVSGQLGPGHVQGIDLGWDADRLVFAYVRQPHWDDPRYQGCWGYVPWKPNNTGADRGMIHQVGVTAGIFWENGSEPTHLYEIGLHGNGLRQLTADKLYCDREPAYLPNGDVVFSSDRGCGASQCGAAPLAYSDFGLPNFFRVSADGTANPAADLQQGRRPLSALPEQRGHRVHAMGLPGAVLAVAACAVDDSSRRDDERRPVQDCTSASRSRCASRVRSPAAGNWW